MNNGNLSEWVPMASLHVEAHQRQRKLREEADLERLAREYRDAHPELQLRSRVARVLRSVADRLAPLEPARPARHFTVFQGSRPSPTH